MQNQESFNTQNIPKDNHEMDQLFNSLNRIEETIKYMETNIN